MKIGNSDLDVYPLNLGGNVFGWTADEQQSFEVLDAYAAAGGNFVDTADSYMHRAPGNSGGESETIIGRWLAKRGRRDDMVIATKVGSWPKRPGVSAKNIREAAEDSLRRLGTGHIDLYYAHRDVADVPLEETLGAFDELVRAGKVRYLGASNYTAERLAEALSISDREGLARYVALQPHYNLVERGYEQDLLPLVRQEGLSTLPYFSLAKGFLTGKYRSRETDTGSPRNEGAVAYLDHRGERVLEALDDISAAHGTTPAAVSLAWLAAQPTVAAPIASARTVEQLSDLIASVELRLSQADLAALAEASA
ncbi:aryl-alcohol dehydrogenase-like predicted oxidoreductase [Amycolatopsis bartoniae]|uniref:NADP-dependent aryl-alcohol dehydrogenase n=1 Tax=Amycolatopsis bartoniae TaxID=941986 RepID=A0A8H9MCP4_9PSEU|nr:aldo/keto reductase [Amycolatopsis bartoniae]MBB2933021.1 aryl-alcohol dehydrogenase-like predicted oxidoreductase [Amycolatopsis bartoniae]TVT03395.1 aldo/keto reductase [Amycolatopsis bartoniae]GHF56443.1 NADP-dependent aryl-alcohol dehydrogenase [Amycolatopsis bartoniae]